MRPWPGNLEVAPGRKTGILLRTFILRRANLRRAAFFLPLGLHPLVPEEDIVMWTIFAILLVLWLLGWGFHIAGALIHLLLVIAVLIVAVSLLARPRKAV
jgi:hypothetical protein